MQVGALRALLEADLRPDLLVGTSIGAVNAAGLTLWGVDLFGIDVLEQAYREVAEANFMDPRLTRLMLSTLARRPNHHASYRVKEFFISKGLTPDLRFDQVKHAWLAVVGSDLNTGQMVIYGQDPGQSVLEGVMASIALPPWFTPVGDDGRLVIDGGVLSNLPIEPALMMGATEIVALDLNAPNLFTRNNLGQYQNLDKTVFAMLQRQEYLEIALAEARGVVVNCISLRCTPSIPIWDFRDYQRLVRTGYEIASRQIAGMLDRE